MSQEAEPGGRGRGGGERGGGRGGGGPFEAQTVKAVEASIVEEAFGVVGEVEVEVAQKSTCTGES
jgi:hypothetical protein